MKNLILVVLLIGLFAIPVSAQKILVGGSGHIMAQNTVVSNLFIAKPLILNFGVSLNYYCKDVFSTDISWKYINVSSGFSLSDGQNKFYTLVLTPLIYKILIYEFHLKAGVNCNTNSIKKINYKNTSTLFGVIIITDLKDLINQFK